MCNCRQGSFYCLAFFIFAFMKKLLLLFLFFTHYALAQEQIVKSVLLDSVTITGVKEGFDIDEFIQSTLSNKYHEYLFKKFDFSTSHMAKSPEGEAAAFSFTFRSGNDSVFKSIVVIGFALR